MPGAPSETSVSPKVKTLCLEGYKGIIFANATKLYSVSKLQRPMAGREVIFLKCEVWLSEGPSGCGQAALFWACSVGHVGAVILWTCPFKNVTWEAWVEQVPPAHLTGGGSVVGDAHQGT